MKILFNAICKSSKNNRWMNFTMKRGPWTGVQRDSHNCGIYVAFTLRVMDEDGEYPTGGIEPDEMRMFYAREILRLSDNMANTCLCCGSTEDEIGHRWVQCDVCNRWAHIQCTNIQKKTKQWDTKLFMCFFCMQYYNVV